ncbi:hypothetical protein FHS83_000940 [Rhizomicrobium palustre]|uniref:Antifreeze protein n=1 Tax=Rhizomicrobium palustre TaxID=189966 RepID=A0A846MX36_9PROT|nr:hypothetical protein [Rhizomicrobium palustre]NIK87622.1 hypothetical protein [Rhizomicrobium palustre]
MGLSKRLSLKTFGMTAFAAALLCTSASFADPPHRDDHPPMRDMRDMRGPDAMRDHDMRGHNDWGKHRDRYWRPEYRGYVARDRIFHELRRHHYNRFDGDPYWYRGRYVVKSFDRRGRRIFVEINPYTGAYIGVVRF